MHIQKLFNIKISVHGLSKFYKKHKILLRHGNYLYKQGLTSREKSKELRKKFCIQLLRLIREQALLCYMDESAVNIWCRMKKVWRKQNEKVFLVVPQQRHS